MALDKTQTSSSKLARAVTRRKMRKGDSVAQAHTARRRQRFEDDYRSICNERYGKRDGFGLRRDDSCVA